MQELQQPPVAAEETVSVSLSKKRQAAAQQQRRHDGSRPRLAAASRGGGGGGAALPSACVSAPCGPPPRLRCRLHRVCSLAIALSAVAWLVTWLLLGYLRYDQRHFTVTEGKWQREEVQGEQRMSMDLMEELSLPEDSCGCSSSSVLGSASTGNHADARTAMCCSLSGGGYSVGRKLRRHQLSTQTTTYTAAELLAKYRAMDIVYSFLNGSDLGHVYRRQFLRRCGDEESSGEGAMLVAEVDYYRRMQRLAAREPLTTPADAAEVRAALRRVLPLFDTAAAAKEAVTGTSYYMRLVLEVPDGEGVHRKRCGREAEEEAEAEEEEASASPTAGARKTVVLAVPRALITAALAAATSFLRAPSASASAAGDAVLWSLPYLEEIASRASAAPTCDPLGVPPLTKLSNANLLAAVRKAVTDTVDNRDRESDELRYSFRSLEQHVRWHTGRVLLVSPGHCPRWLDHAKGFLASLCADSQADFDGRVLQSAMAEGGRFVHDFLRRQRRWGRGGAAAEAPEEEEEEEEEQHGGAVCFHSPAEREAFTRAHPKPPPASVKQPVKAFALTEGRHHRNELYILSTDLTMADYRLGVALRRLPRWSSRGEGGVDSSSGSMINRTDDAAAEFFFDEEAADERGDGVRDDFFLTTEAAQHGVAYAYFSPYRAASSAAGGLAAASATDTRVVRVRLGKRLYEQCNALEHRQAGASHPHRRLHVVHQDTVLPHAARLTINSFTVEMNLFRLKNLSSLHLYINDDYFFNRALPITALVNRFGGAIVRGDHLLPTARRGSPESSDWRAGVDHTNLFVIRENDDCCCGGAAGAAANRGDRLLPRSLMEMWRREGRLSLSTEGEGTCETASLHLQPPQLHHAYSLAQDMLAAYDRDRPASEGRCWRDTLSELFGRPPAVAQSTTRSHDDFFSTAFSPWQALRDEEAWEEEGGGNDPHHAMAAAMYLPEPLPRTVLAKHHRRFSMHAPFTYCTAMFRYLSQRYEREFSLQAFVHRRRSATSLHPPYLHNDFLLKRPWVASETFLPYVAQRRAYVEQRHEREAAAVRGGRLDNGSDTETHRGRGQRDSCNRFVAPPSPLSLLLDNDDACAPATLLARGKGESRFTKFTNDFHRNALQVDEVESAAPLMFNINTDFTWGNVSAFMQTYLSVKYPIPSFLEDRGDEDDGRPIAFPADESPFYPFVRHTIHSHAQRRRQQQQQQQQQQPRQEDPPNAAREDPSRPQLPLPPGVTLLPPRMDHLRRLFDALMRRVPLFLIADDEEAFCPLMRSLQLALPEYRGRQVFLLCIPPNITAEAPRRQDHDHGREARHRTSLAVLRARSRYPITHFMPVSLCADMPRDDGDVQCGLPHPRPAAPAGEEARCVGRFTFPPGTAAGLAVHHVLRRALQGSPARAAATVSSTEAYFLQHTAALPRGGDDDTAAELVHAFVIDGRTGVLELLSKGETEEEEPGRAAPSRKHKNRRAWTLLSSALAIPGQLLALEDFTPVDLLDFLRLPSPLDPQRTAETGRTAGEEVDDVLSFLRRQLRPHEGGAARYFGPRVKHHALLLRFAEDERTTRPSPAPPVHWITGASEVDLLSSFPLPSTVWERNTSESVLSYHVG